MAAATGAILVALCLVGFRHYRMPIKADSSPSNPYVVQNNIRALGQEEVKAIFYTQNIPKGSKITHSMLAKTLISRRNATADRVGDDLIIWRRPAGRNLKINDLARLSDFGLLSEK